MISKAKINVDLPLLGTAIVLSLFGIAMVYSAGQTDVKSFVANLWKTQLVWFFGALFVAFMVSRASVRLIEWMTPPLYYLSLFTLVLTLVGFGAGAGTAASTKSWLAIGGIRLGQPSEIAKVTTVLMLAKVLSEMRGTPKTLLELWKPLLVVAVPWVLVMAQPDLGSGLVFIGILFGMLFWAGVPWPLLLLTASPAISLVLAFSPRIWGAWFLLLVALILWYKPYMGESIFAVAANVLFGVLAPILWESLKPYQQKRLLVFLDPMADPRQSGYHVLQSKVAIGSGGLFGKGFTEGTQKRLAFLPEQHTDFIFAVVGEELGFLGVTVALSLFFILFLRIVRIAERANDSFGSMVAFGLLSSWFVHILVNVGMTLSLMPITGIPLPFFSYGGSFLLASWLAVGVLLRIAHEGRGGKGGRLAD
jgi:rod shape determining protein RodA